MNSELIIKLILYDSNSSTITIIHANTAVLMLTNQVAEMQRKLDERPRSQCNIS